MITFDLPMWLASEANMRDSRKEKIKRAAEQRGLARMRTRAATTAAFRDQARKQGVVIVVCRISPGRLDKHDNLTMACKATVDGIADGLDFPNDSHPALDWRYAQARGAPGQYGVRVALSLRSPAPVG